MCISPYVDHKTMTAFGCYKCFECRLDRKAWKTGRILLEARLHPDNVAFATVTYAPEHLVTTNNGVFCPLGTLVPRDAQLFLKRLRKAADAANPGTKIKFVLAGEYGPQGRPHYHLVLFGIRCRRHQPKLMPNGQRQCDCSTCTLVRNSWAKGHTKVQEFGSAQARYIAKYITKATTDPKDPWLKGRHPEFMRQSNRPGVGFGTIPTMAKAFMDREEQMQRLKPPKRFLDVLPGFVEGRSFIPFDNAFKRRLRSAVGRRLTAPDEIRAKGLVRDIDIWHQVITAYPSGWNYRARAKMASQLIGNRDMQKALNKQARERFPRTRNRA